MAAAGGRGTMGGLERTRSRPLKTPRFRIAWLMLVVAFAAFDLGAVRALFGLRDTFSELVGVGVLPMANLLAVAALAGASGRRHRPFLLGFLACGGSAASPCSPGRG